MDKLVEDKQKTAPQRLAREVIYESSWVNLYADRVEFPGGRIIDRHHFIHFEQDSVGALVENEEGQLLLVESYRYTTGTIEWELPAGRIEVNESPLEGGRREVMEESGYDSLDHRLIYSFFGLIGISNIQHHIIHCRTSKQIADFDTNEVRSVRWFSHQEISAMVDSNVIRDAYTLVAVLMWLRGLPKTVIQ